MIPNKGKVFNSFQYMTIFLIQFFEFFFITSSTKLLRFFWHFFSFCGLVFFHITKCNSQFHYFIKYIAISFENRKIICLYVISTFTMHLVPIFCNFIVLCNSALYKIIFFNVEKILIEYLRGDRGTFID